MKVIAYLRVSKDTQDLEKQKHLLLEYAHKNKYMVDEFMELEVSSRETMANRKIDELLEKLDKGDILLVAELSRLGRNMLETLNIINELSGKGIKIIFVRQLELSTTATHGKLLTAIYSYFAEAERDYISIRTKQGLAAAKAKGKQLGRPKGSKNMKGRILDQFKDDITGYLKLKLPLRSILKIINDRLDKPVSYNTLKYYINNEKDLKKSLDSGKVARISLWLRVENNSKFVRMKGKVRTYIEDYILREYNMKKKDKNGCEYELTIPYKNDKDLDDIMYDLLDEMQREADMHNCFTESDAKDMNSDKSW